MLSCFCVKAETIEVTPDSTLNHVCLVVQNVNQEINFYQDVLGFKITDMGIRSGKEIESALGLPSGTKFKIYRASSPDGHFFVELIHFLKPVSQGSIHILPATYRGFNHFGIEVNDVDETYKILKKADTKIISKPVVLKESGAKLFFAYDPEGNRIEFFKPKIQEVTKHDY